MPPIMGASWGNKINLGAYPVELAKARAHYVGPCLCEKVYSLVERLPSVASVERFEAWEVESTSVAELAAERVGVCPTCSRGYVTTVKPPKGPRGGRRLLAGLGLAVAAGLWAPAASYAVTATPTPTATPTATSTVTTTTLAPGPVQDVRLVGGSDDVLALAAVGGGLVTASLGALIVAQVGRR